MKNQFGQFSDDRAFECDLSRGKNTLFETNLTCLAETTDIKSKTTGFICFSPSSFVEKEQFLERLQNHPEVGPCLFPRQPRRMKHPHLTELIPVLYDLHKHLRADHGPGVLQANLVKDFPPKKLEGTINVLHLEPQASTGPIDSRPRHWLPDPGILTMETKPDHTIIARNQGGKGRKLRDIELIVSVREEKTNSFWHAWIPLRIAAP